MKILRLRMFGDSVLRRKFGPKREVTNTKKRILNSQKLHNLCIARVIKWIKIGWTSYVARIGKENCSNILLRKPHIMDLREIYCQDVKWMELITLTGLCNEYEELSDSIPSHFLLFWISWSNSTPYRTWLCEETSSTLGPSGAVPQLHRFLCYTILCHRYLFSVTGTQVGLQLMTTRSVKGWIRFVDILSRHNTQEHEFSAARTYRCLFSLAIFGIHFCHKNALKLSERELRKRCSYSSPPKSLLIPDYKVTKFT